MSEHRLWAVLTNPAAGVDADGFNAWYDELHARVAARAPRTRLRLCRITAEQLLPNRAAGAHHDYLALYEGPGDELPAAGVPLPGLGADVDDRCWEWVDRASLCRFVGDRIHDTVEPTALPGGMLPPPYLGPTGDGPGIFFALSNPTSPADEAEYNRWYDTIHVPDTLMLPGMVRGSRYRRVADVPVVGDDYREQCYLAKYEIDDVAKIPGARAATAWMADVSVDFRSVTFDGSSVRAFSFAVLSDIGPVPSAPVFPSTAADASTH